MFGYGAFGKIVLWNEDKQEMSIDLPYLRAGAGYTADKWQPFDPDIAITSIFYSISDKSSYTLFENTEKAAPLFPKCVKQYGRLDLGECYGLVPALALGRSTDLKTIKRVSAREHFAILAQLGEIRLIRYVNGVEKHIRNLGQ